jgi:ubiquinone biosynthesis protein COQ4
MAGLNIRKQVRSDAPVLKAVTEGKRLGKACPRLCEQSIIDLLPLPLEEVRRKLNITPAEHYREAHATWASMGIDPYDLLGKNLKKAA